MPDATESNRTLMWEAKTDADHFTQLLTWLDTIGIPSLQGLGVEISTYSSSEFRAVLIATGPLRADARLPDPPSTLTIGPPRQWHFTRRPRG